jgi:diguanylate cyclase
MVHEGLSLNTSAIKKPGSKKAFIFSIILGNDPKQALRLRRFFTSLAIYSFNLFLFYLAYQAGIIEFHALYWSSIFLFVLVVILYIVFRTGLNLWMSDPSLTSIQMCVACLFVLYGIYYAHEVRGIFFSMYILILLFGIFRLYTRQFLLISAFALLTYGVDIVLLNIFRPQNINLKIEFFQWFGLAIVLVSVSFIGGNISSIRRELGISRKKLQSSLTVIREMAIHDDLTGFYNRHHLMDLIDSENNRSERTGSVYSLVMMDIDKFKSINDTYGHQIGDQVLRTFAAIIRGILRKTDFCGRYGGEEFLVVLTQTDIKAAKVFAERIRDCVENSFFPCLGHESRVTVSMGLTEYRANEKTEQTISRADELLYKAKNGGRNRLEC